MWFYARSFRLFSTSFIFIIACNTFVESVTPKYYVISIENEDSQYLLSDDDKNIQHDVPTVLIILVGLDEEVKDETFGGSIKENERDLRIAKEKKEHSALREKRENACIKVAIRKCYKAFMSVKKKVCKSRYKCSRHFKDDFDEYSKSACIKEFDNNKITNEYYYKDKYSVEDTFKGYTRQDYLEVCIPHMTRQLKSKDPNDESKKANALVTHIFRTSDSISARRCRKICQEKCIHACSYVRKNICSLYGCAKGKRRFFKKACKKECKGEYRVREWSESSDTD